MRGHVFKRGNTWSYKFDLDVGADGRRRQRSRGGFASKRKAQAALAEELARTSHGRALEPTRMTVAEYLQGQWLPSLHDLRPNTRLSYETLARRHVVPHLGQIPLTKLITQDCDRLYTLLGQTVTSKGRPLSPATIRRIHALLHSALNSALDRNLVPRNVADRVRLPRVPRPTLATWSPEELVRFLEHAAGDRLAGLYLLLATTGLRRGEAVGLPWSAVDLDAGALSVRQALLSIRYRTEMSEPKTRHGERVVALDRITVEVLRLVRLQQQRDAATLGRAWTDTGLVFTREDGSAWHPEYVSKHFIDLAKAAGVPVIRLHGLRHTHASLGLRGGVHLKVMQERLGHSSISVTGDLYSHVAPALQRDAAQQVADQALGSWKPSFPFRSQQDPGDDSAACPEDQNKPLTREDVCALGGTRTPNLLIRSQMLYPLSYERRSGGPGLESSGSPSGPEIQITAATTGRFSSRSTTWTRSSPRTSGSKKIDDRRRSRRLTQPVRRPARRAPSQSQACAATRATRDTGTPHVSAAQRYGSGAGFQRRTSSTDSVASTYDSRPERASRAPVTSALPFVSVTQRTRASRSREKAGRTSGCGSSERKAPSTAETSASPSDSGASDSSASAATSANAWCSPAAVRAKPSRSSRANHNGTDPASSPTDSKAEPRLAREKRVSFTSKETTSIARSSIR